ncbi:hypothetical protein MNBD_ALPHA12-1944 [hydrothermal vent metagenome]|uniref:Cytochrome c domain-containing protein n=1 Tax=hydrothermal vent metagenome TaxID=652676 RepID=A0A3B0UHC6_9ZZZZ
MRGLFATALFAVAAGGAGYFWLQSFAQTPGELFNVKCATCHELPDLAGYTARQKGDIVMTMLNEQGANQLISAAEAGKIIQYITAIDRSISQEDQGNGDT